MTVGQMYNSLISIQRPILFKKRFPRPESWKIYIIEFLKIFWLKNMLYKILKP